MGVALWFRPDGEHSESALAYQYGEFALRVVGAGPAHAAEPSGGSTGIVS
jgi:hypothetical protein